MFMAYLSMEYLTRTPLQSALVLHVPIGVGLCSSRACHSDRRSAFRKDREDSRRQECPAARVIDRGGEFHMVFPVERDTCGDLGRDGDFVRRHRRRLCLRYQRPYHVCSTEQNWRRTAVNTVFRIIRGAVGTAVAGALLTLYEVSITVALPAGPTVVLAPTSQAFAYIAVVALVLSLVGVVTAYVLKRAPDIELPDNQEPHVPAG